MSYPVLYGGGELGLKSPSAQPGETVFRTLTDFRRQVKGSRAQLVPWVQDWSYTPQQVLAQIAAARLQGAKGYLLWNASGIYTKAALAPARHAPRRLRRRNPPREPIPGLRYAAFVAATRTIDIRTEIPGPRSQELLERGGRALAKPLQVYLPVFAAEALNSTITDVDGNTFIDFAGGVGVCNVGHCHPRVVEAIQEQSARFVHTDFTVVPYERYVELAERLGDLAPLSGPTRAAFFNSGAEAVENAVKIARLATGRQAVIAFEAAFHGRTLLALTMTSKVHPYKTGHGPVRARGLPGAVPERVPRASPHERRSPRSSACSRPHVAASQIAAIVFEPQLGEGGFVPAPAEFVEGLRRICDREGIVLVADEVQTGFGRTGRMFAMEHYEVEADLIDRGQVDRRRAAALGRDRQGRDHGRAPHAARSAARSSATPSPSRRRSRCSTSSPRRSSSPVPAPSASAIRARMLSWQARWPQIGDVRGLGAMLALELVRDPATKEPAPDLALAVIDAALGRGLILLKAGLAGTASACSAR